MTSYEVIKNLEVLFQHLNERYFDNTLPLPYITLYAGAKKNGNGSHGSFYLDKYVNVNNDEDYKHEIGIAGERLGDGIYQVAETLMHEMVHLYCTCNAIVDCKGKSHTKKFKAECEKRDLICDKEQGIGWGRTEATLAFCDFIQSLIDDCIIDTHICDYARYTTFPETSSVQKKSYICPCCGVKVNAKVDTAIACLHCNVAFDYWDMTDPDDPKIITDNNNGLAMTDEGWYGQMFGVDENADSN